MIRLSLLLTAAGSLLLAGCVLPPDDKPQEQALAAPGLGLSSRPAPQVASDWWRSLHDPQFDRLVQRALNGNPGLAETLARLRQARAQVEVVHSDILPQASLDGADTRQRFSKNDIYPPPYAGGTFWEGNIGANLSWDIDFWGRQAALVDQARGQADAVALDYEGARLALIGALAQSYVELDRAYALADVARLTLAQREHILDITRKLVASGLDTNVELRETDGAVAQARVDLETAENARLRAVHELAALVGTGADTYASIARPTFDADAALPLPASLPADLLARRPDIRAAQQRVEAALAGKKAASAAFYPDIDLRAFVGLASFGITPLFQASSATYGVGPAIHLPLFDAGRLEAEYKGSVAGIDVSVAAYNDTIVKAVQQVADGLSDIESLRRELAAQKVTLDDDEDAFRLASLRYDAGLTNYLVELNAETELLAARRQRVDLVHAQALNRIRLVLAIGGGFDPAHPAAATETPLASAQPEQAQ